MSPSRVPSSPSRPRPAMLALLVLAGAALFLNQSFLVPGWPATHEGYSVFWRSLDAWVGWQAGWVVPRWSASMLGGQGHAFGSYYAPLAAWLPIPAMTAGLDVIAANKVAVFLMTWLGLLGAFLLGRVMIGTPAGLLAAVAFGLSDYRMACLVVRGAFAEYLAGSVLPWLLFFTVLAVRRRGAALVGLAVAQAALLLAHNLIALFAAPLSVVVAAVLLWPRRAVAGSWSRALITGWLIAGALALGTGLAAIYWLPMAAEMQLVQIGRATQHYTDARTQGVYPYQFISPLWGAGGMKAGHAGDGMSLAPGAFGMLLLLPAVVLGCLALRRGGWRRTRPRLTAAAVGAALLYLGLASMWGRVVWDLVPALGAIQFPARLMTIGSLFLALGGAWVVDQAFGLRAARGARLPMFLLASVLLCLAGHPRLMAASFIEKLAEDEAPWRLREWSRHNTNGEYLPHGMDKVPEGSILLRRWPLVEGPIVVDPLRLGAFEYLVRVELQEGADPASEAAVTLPPLCFPFWEASLDGELLRIEPTPQGHTRIRLPGDRLRTGSLVRLVLRPTPVQRIAAAISTASLLLLVAAAVGGAVSGARRSPRGSLGSRLRAWGRALLVLLLPPAALALVLATSDRTFHTSPTPAPARPVLNLALLQDTGSGPAKGPYALLSGWTEEFDPGLPSPLPDRPWNLMDRDAAARSLTVYFATPDGVRRVLLLNSHNATHRDRSTRTVVAEVLTPELDWREAGRIELAEGHTGAWQTLPLAHDGRTWALRLRFPDHHGWGPALAGLAWE